MTVPYSSRERRLHHSATMRRGFPSIHGTRDKEDPIENKNNTNVIFSQDNGDEYLLCGTLSFLEDLTQLLVNVPPHKFLCLVNPVDMLSTSEKRTSRAFESLELLQKYIATIETPGRRSLFSKMEPEFDVLQELNCDPVWFLDYLPMLRDICNSEHNADSIFQATLQAAGEAITSTNRKFNTRGSAKRGRKHYLEEIIPNFVWNTFNTTALEIGGLIRSLSLNLNNFR
jgi:hypothetical protein